MGKIIKKMYIGLRIKLRILKLYFMHVPEPEDAKTVEQMSKEIKEALKFT